MAKNGLHLLKPTTVDKTGGSSTATINANGSVTFGACTSLSLNGVFSADYDNYMIVMRDKATGTIQVNYRLRSSGVDTSTTTYTFQELYADSVTLTAARATSQTLITAHLATTTEAGFILYAYGPHLVQPTAFRSIGLDGRSGALMNDMAGTQSGSASFDGITFTIASQTFGGRVAVYGMRK